jgi:hypothetical protein
VRVAAAYGLIFYGVLTVLTVKAGIARGRMSTGAGLAQALVGITMIFAALGVLMGLWLGLLVALVSIIAASVLTAYHAILLDGRSGLRAQAPRTAIALLLIAALLFG